MSLRIIISLVMIFVLQHAHAQLSHFGIFYSYGAHFNFHPSNQQQFLPADGSALGAYYQLDNGLHALGFRSSFSRRNNDFKFRISDNTYITNTQHSLELKLQCTLPFTTNNIIALGISPRMITQSRFELSYVSQSGGNRYEEQRTLANGKGELNELNTALSISWYHQIASRWQFAIHLDQDMLSSYQKDVEFPEIPALPSASINGRLTSITGSIILSVR